MRREYGEWIVPWEDGFLVGSMAYQPQPLPDELPEEVVALFPQEVIDLFGGDLPATISEATEQLSEAGLLEVVSEIIQNNPAASEAIYGVETGPPTLDVRYTVDGITWEPREVVAPPGATYFSGVDRRRRSPRRRVLQHRSAHRRQQRRLRHRGDHLRPVHLDRAGHRGAVAG